MPRGRAEVMGHLSSSSLGPPSRVLGTFPNWWKGAAQPSGALSITAAGGVTGGLLHSSRQCWPQPTSPPGKVLPAPQVPYKAGAAA